MNVLDVREVIKQEVDRLPEALFDEVLDFILFVQARRAEETYLWQKVEEAKAYDREHPEEVVTVTAEEWMALTAYMDDETA